MSLLVLGLAIWFLAHTFKSVAPERRAALSARFGVGPARGIFAVAILIGLVLMILGFRGAPYVALYTPPAWAIHVNNLLMLIAVVLFGAANSPSRIKQYLRNPMLTGVVVWAVAHLLVNGDLASLILFGGLGLWAIVNIRLIDGASPWVRPTPGPVAAEIRLGVIAVVVFAVIAAIHTWLGYWPFPQ